MIPVLHVFVTVLALLGIQKATEHSVPLSTLVLLLPFALLATLVASLPITLVFGHLDDRIRERLGAPSREERVRAASRPLSFASPAAWSVVQLRARWDSAPRSSTSKPPLHALAPPALSAAVDQLLSRIIDDFVLAWYTKISPSSTFPNHIEDTIRHALSSIAALVEAADLPSLVVSKITPILTSHLLSFSNAEQSLRLSKRSSTVTSEGMDLFLSQAYGPNSLHPVVAGKTLETRPAEEAHLRILVERILMAVLPEKERVSRAVMIMAREIVACTVLMPIVEMLSDPDFWNRMLDEQAGNYIREQNLVHQLRTALDQSLPHRDPSAPSSSTTSGAPGSAPSTPLKKSISSKTDAKSFDGFVRGIGKMENLMDLRRLRSDLANEIRRTRATLNAVERGRETETGGDSPLTLKSYLERLEVARSKAEQRILKLSGRDGNPIVSALPPKISAPFRKLDLLTVLTNPSSLSYFMEFMERRQGMMLVQYWLTVESFKEPLEDVEAGQTDDLFRGARTAGYVETAREDLRGVWEVYFEEEIVLGEIGIKYGEDIRRFVFGTGDEGIFQARKSAFLAQKEVFAEMQEDFFHLFERSDLFFKALANTSSTQPTSNVLPHLPTPIPQPPSFPHRQNASPNLPPPHLFSSPPPSRTPPLPFTPPSLALTDHRAGSQPKASSPQLSIESPTFDRKLQRVHSSEPPTDPRPISRRSLTWSSESSSTATVSPSSSAFVHTVASSSTAAEPKAHLDFLTSSDSTSSSRAPLFADFDDHPGASPSSSSAPSEKVEGKLDWDAEDEDDFIQIQRIDAIQAALTSIIAKDRSAKPPSPSSSSSSTPTHRKLPTSSRRTQSQTSMSRSLDSLPLPETPPLPSRRTMRSSMELPPILDVSPSNPPLSMPDLPPSRSRSQAGSKRVFFEDDEVTPPPFERSASVGVEGSDDETGDDKVHFASPGDLQLPSEIARLSQKLEKLHSQEPILDALIRKAELTGNEHELQLLERSQSGLLREIRTLSFQRATYEQQELDNRLDPKRTKISIPSSTNVDEDGRVVVRYLIEVQQMAKDGSYAQGWVVARRYNEFFSLHHDLRERFPSTRHLSLPGKMIATAMTSSFVDSRRSGLERYLQLLLLIPDACNSTDLRAFLSQQVAPTASSPDLASEDPSKKSSSSFSSSTATASFLPQNLVKSIYRTVTTGLDDSLFAGPSMLDLIGQRLTRQAGDLAEFAGIGSTEAGASSTATSRVAPATASSPAPEMLNLPPELKPLEGETASSYFTAPICDLFIEVFELKENNWLRRQAIVIILQQILGGTIERKLREVTNRLIGPSSLLKYLSSFSNSMWPDGQRRPPSVPRTDAQKAKTKVDANKKLSALMPDVASNMIGRGNARRGARRLFAAVQNRRLNQHLVHTILDEIVDAVFPAVKGEGAGPKS